jgi:6-phosphogluconolactonase (cycloisomerase 2 family)
VSTYNASIGKDLSLIQAETFTMDGRGPNRNRQEAPHPHQAVVDPTGQYVVVPDLGADLVRIFAIDPVTLGWKATDPLVAAPGSGPRHIAFLKVESKIYMFLISELANSLTTYEVVYNGNKTLSFVQVFSGPTHGTGNTVPPGASAAEIAISVSFYSPPSCAPVANLQACKTCTTF